MAQEFLGSTIRSFAVAGFTGSPAAVGVVLVDYQDSRHTWLFDKASARIFSDNLLKHLGRHFTDIRGQLQQLDHDSLERLNAIAEDYARFKPTVEASVLTVANRGTYKKFSSFDAVNDGIVVDITGLDDATERFSILPHLAFKLADEVRAAESRI
ncbi:MULTISPECIES: hypothetical protein [unclassified Mesorhizobium]|uniref:hypothetical protein n=1 Tax=unclassified Mesorhizobium TaxID=325217 RepID=UPI001127359A|nr:MULTISPECIES: hypothetical protein [unclassified Mesorhizobium]MBZ9699544.1 hypothetical protein [Mesorhizobium sp. CO1-1-3]MBZ9945797.1 hypothetical protein [Mesorhizobium sp. BR1-1-11]TPJ08227.1 hypothetical protein FJ428_07955 [Mesorhizobium sp. B2-8-1]